MSVSLCVCVCVCMCVRARACGGGGGVGIGVVVCTCNQSVYVYLQHVPFSNEVSSFERAQIGRQFYHRMMFLTSERVNVVNL